MKIKNAVRLATLLAIAGILAGSLSGCAWSIGGEKGVAQAQPTRGQELLDLKKARDQGAITEDEYQAQKKRVMEK